MVVSRDGGGFPSISGAKVGQVYVMLRDTYGTFFWNFPTVGLITRGCVGGSKGAKYITPYFPSQVLNKRAEKTPVSASRCQISPIKLM